MGSENGLIKIYHIVAIVLLVAISVMQYQVWDKTDVTNTPGASCPAAPPYAVPIIDDSGKPDIDDEGCQNYNQCWAPPVNSVPKIDDSGKPDIDDDGCQNYNQCWAQPVNSVPKIDDSGKPDIDDDGCQNYFLCPEYEDGYEPFLVDGVQQVDHNNCPKEVPVDSG